jgi:uncharacterized membrane protein YqjE
VRRGPLGALRRVSARSLTLLLSRAELAALELGQARTRAVRWLFLSLACTAVFALALLAASAALVAALWDRFGVLTLVVLGLVFAVAGFLVLLRLQREIDTAPPILSATLAEFAKDRDAFFGEDDTAPTQESGRDAPRGTASQARNDQEPGGL